MLLVYIRQVKLSREIYFNCLRFIWPESARQSIKSQPCLVRFKRSMPPKKKGAEAEGPGPLLGRFGTSLKCGIVGLPNVGWGDLRDPEHRKLTLDLVWESGPRLPLDSGMLWSFELVIVSYASLSCSCWPVNSLHNLCTKGLTMDLN